MRDPYLNICNKRVRSYYFFSVIPIIVYLPVLIKSIVVLDVPFPFPKPLTSPTRSHLLRLKIITSLEVVSFPIPTSKTEMNVYNMGDFEKE